MLALVDSDHIVYGAAFAAQKKAWSVELDGETLCVLHKKDDAVSLAEEVEGSFEECAVLKPEGITKWYADKLVKGIIDTTQCTSYQLYLTPQKTFRDKYETYKANRTAAKPLHYGLVRDHLVEKWEAEICDGIEADDMLSLIGWQAWKSGDELPLLVHVDKDINQVPGFHVNPKTGEEYYITESQARKEFWRSMLTGDVADNIKGIHGCGPVKAEKIFDESDDWEQTVREFYSMARLDYDTNYTLLKLLETGG